MRTVITYGTFDLFHIGHVRLLSRLREMGDRLIVACSTDEFNRAKGKSSVIPYEQRKEILLACRYVDAVIPEQDWQQKRHDILRESADIFGMGAGVSMISPTSFRWSTCLAPSRFPPLS